jgi:hypothetical protein
MVTMIRRHTEWCEVELVPVTYWVAYDRDNPVDSPIYRDQSLADVLAYLRKLAAEIAETHRKYPLAGYGRLRITVLKHMPSGKKIRLRQPAAPAPGLAA